MLKNWKKIIFNKKTHLVEKNSAFFKIYHFNISYSKLKKNIFNLLFVWLKNLPGKTQNIRFLHQWVKSALLEMKKIHMHPKVVCNKRFPLP